MSTPSIAALIPARAGSKRLPDKNIRHLAGHPMMAYTIQAARASGIFSDVVVSTDSRRYAQVAVHYGARVPFLRPQEFAADVSPDIEWVQLTLAGLEKEGHSYDAFSILRPTSPFRGPETIRRAWNEFLKEKNADSLRAVERVKQHPGKMWTIHGKRMTPIFPSPNPAQPYHSSQMASLPEIYIQNASLEIAWSRVVRETHTIAGREIMPFATEGYEGFDINDMYDWKFAEELIRTGSAVLPRIEKEAYAENLYYSQK
ncbi:MAG: acylneuraminate cytidylyltransferase family protein [Candidatus Omnitrophica bacterium]|nr:acylneuraminate cytidylyltransferase family protein [Candidatus Omnitrophota bacterium]